MPAPPPEDLLRRAFDAYNRQDADALLAMVSDEVRWTTDRGPLVGKAALRDYWDRQWRWARTHDRVLAVRRLAEGVYDVTLDQTVRSVEGGLISTGRFDYGFEVRGGLIERLASIAVAQP